MVFNSLQSEIPSDISKYVKSELHEAIDQIDFISNLISDTRPTISSLPLNEDNTLSVNITNPHILEDMDYFRKPALHFLEHGVYCPYYPNTNPNSEFWKFWKEEARKCRTRVIREDGEWIPGLYYFYLNYAPIIKVVEHDNISSRVEGFPDVYDGDYLYFHYLQQARFHKKHAMCLKARGRGFSFKAAAILAMLFILGENEKANKKVKGYAIADEKEYLIKDGTLNKFLDQIDFCADHTPWPHIRDLKDSMGEMHWKMGYKEKGETATKGTQNEIIGVSLKNDPQRARGKRGSYIMWEEVGKAPGFLDAWKIARPSVEAGNKAFGLMSAFGTGGTEGADFRGAEEMFYNPEGYNVLDLPNVFDKGTRGKTEAAFFFPDFLNREDCYDANGNSDVIKALIQLFEQREIIKNKTSDPHALTAAKAEAPICPQEAVMRREGTVFPVGDIKDRLATILPDLNSFIAQHYIGSIQDTGNGLDIKVDLETNIIRDYPLKDNVNKNGGLEIFKLPIPDPPRYRYIAGVDPYDDDHSTTNSLGSLFVFDMFTDKVVAEYTGRPRTANEFYANCLKIAQFYNATINYENDKKGMFAYFSNANALHYLCDTPEILKDMDLVKGQNYGNKSKGTNSSKMINMWGRRLQADYMVEPYTYEDAEGNEIHTTKLHTIRSIPYLKECEQWNPDVNADRVSAMGMLMIYRESLQKILIQEFDDKIDSLMNDPFWDRPFTRKNANKLSYTKKVSYIKESVLV